MPQLTIEITDEQAIALESLVATGVYTDSNGILSAALDELDLRYRLDHAGPATIQRLRELVQIGINSATAGPLDFEEALPGGSRRA